MKKKVRKPKDITNLTHMARSSNRLLRTGEEMKLDKDVIECIIMVDEFFDDYDKTHAWFTTKNPLLGNITPMFMIARGKVKKLKQFILNLRHGNIA